MTRWVRLFTTPRSLVGLASTLLFLALAFRAAPVDQVSQALSTADYVWLVPGVLAQFVALLARSRRWQVLLQGKVSFAEAFWAQSIGFLGNNVLPLRAGEAMRVLAVNRRTGVPLALVASTVVLERAVDVASVLALLACVLPFVSVPPLIGVAATALAATLLAVVLGVGIALVAGGHSVAALPWLTHLVPVRLQQPLRSGWDQLVQGLAALRDRRAVGEIVLWSVLTILFSVAMYWAVIQAVVPGPALVEPAFAVAAVSVGVSLPSSPGFVGVFQFIGQQALVLPFPLRYTAGSALSVALLSHLIYYVLTTSAGIIGLGRLGLSLGALRTAPAEQATPVHSTAAPSPTA
jgi:uncharacterized protein (TIRG00374 family)